MAKDDRLIELMAEMVIKQDQLIEEVRNVKGEIVTLNLQSAENTRAILKLAEKLRRLPTSRVGF